MTSPPIHPVPPGEPDQSAPGETPGPSGEPASPSGVEEVPASLRSWDRYRVEALIGVGGMGRVYRAWDPNLKRTVALKFLRGGEAPALARFEREAQAQARVQHQNVCAVYEVGRREGLPYIAMQCIAGRTLRDAAKDLGLRERVQVMRDVAEAVHAAHQRSLVHRDIKPANILLEKREEGYVPFVTDFGLARDLEGPGVTQAGAIIGTPQYMAPEQVRGETDTLDARTDVYGLGATLYDVLAGVPPFAGTSNLQTLYRTLNDEAPPLRKRNAALPAALEAVVMKCLEKKPERRYASARELSEELGRWLAGEPVLARPHGLVHRSLRKAWARKPLLAGLGLFLILGAGGALYWPRAPTGPATVAVADFVNETRDTDLDGLSGMLITALEQSPRLSVLTRARMRDVLRGHFGKDDVAHIDESLGREVGRVVNADALLVSTIRKFDELYTIELRAIEPRSGNTLFALSEQAKGKSSLPALIDRLSRESGRRLRSREQEPQAAVSAVTTDNLEAYQHYFRGDDLIERLRFRESQEEMLKAIEADRHFGLAYYRLGYSAMWLKDGKTALENVERAVKLIRRVPERERYLILALQATLTGKWQDAVMQYQKCLQRFPQEKEAAFNLGDLAFHGGSYEAGVHFFKQTLDLDPGHERALQHLVWSYQLLGKPREMVDAARLYVDRVGNPNARSLLGRALTISGDLVGARRAHEESERLFPHNPLPVADLATLDTWEGHFDAAEARVRPLLQTGRPTADRKLALQAIAEAQTSAGRLTAAHATLDELAREAKLSGDLDLAAHARAMQGFSSVQLKHDLKAGHAALEQAWAEGLPEPHLGYVDPYVGEYDRYSNMLRGLGFPYVDQLVRAYKLRELGQHAQSIADFAKLAQVTPWRDVLLFEKGYAELQAHRPDQAAESLRQAVAVWPDPGEHGLGAGTGVRARALYELGLAYEAQNDRAKALATFEKLLQQWSKADPDLPDLVDAKIRARRLRGMPPQR